MTLARKVVQSPNLITFVNEVVDLALDGWQLDENNPPGTYGFSYEAHLLKDENLIPPHKPSRAEILGNARAAKAAKKTEPIENPDEPK